MGVSDFGSNETESSKKQAYREAVSRAKERALMLIEGTGQTLGPTVKLLHDGRDRTDAIESFLASSEERAAKIVSLSCSALPPRTPSTFRKKYLDETRSATIVYEIR